MLPEDEDNYGQEMGIYLDMDDVVSDPKRPVSNDITQFVTHSTRNQEVEGRRKGTEKQNHGHDKRGESEKLTAVTGKRKRKQLPNIEAEQNSDDSDVLPDVDFSVTLAGHAGEPATGATSSDEGMSKFLGFTPLHKREKRQKTTTLDVGETSDFEGGEHLKCKELETKKSKDADGTSSKNVNGGEIRIPTPPPVDEIPLLLSLVAPEDWMFVDVDSIISACKYPVLDPFSNCVPLRLTHHLDRSGLAGPKNKQCDFKVNSCNSLPEHLSVDSLSDSDFDALEEKILQKTLKEEVCQSRAGTAANFVPHSTSQAQAEKVEGSDAETSDVSDFHGVQVSQHVSQAELKAKKRLFKHSDVNTSGPDNREFQLDSRTDRSKNCVKQKSSFVYSFSQGSSQAPSPCKRNVYESRSVKECQSIMVSTSEGSIPVCGEENKISTSLRHKCKVSEHKGVLPDDWVTGRQLLQSEMDRRKTSESHDKLSQDTSISDSFFDKNFLDDDGDFEDTEPLPRKSPNPPKKKSTHKSPKARPADLSERKAVSSGSNTPMKLPVSTAAITSPTSAAEHIRNDSMVTFTQALACIRSHSASDPSHSGSNKDSMEEVHSDMDPHHENSPELLTGDTTEGRRCDQVQSGDLPAAQEKGEEEERPNFDLGFDFDEDIIPPSPEAEASVSQLTGKSLMSKPAVILSLKNGRGDSGEALECVAEADEFDSDDSFLHFVEEGVEQDSPCFSSSVQSKPVPSFGLSESEPTVTAEAAHQPPTNAAKLETEKLPKTGKRKLTLSLGSKGKHEELAGCSKRQHGCVNGVVGVDIIEAAQASSQGFEYHRNLEANDGGASYNASQSKPANSAAHQKGRSFGCASEDLLSTQTSKPQLKLSSIGTSNPIDEDTTFQGLEDLSANFALDADIEDDFELGLIEMESVPLTKTPVLAAKFGASMYCSTPVSGKKQNTSLSAKHNTTESSARRKAAFSLALEEGKK